MEWGRTAVLPTDKAEKDRRKNVNETRTHLRCMTRWSTAALEDRRKQHAQMHLGLKPITSLFLPLSSALHPLLRTPLCPHLIDRQMGHCWCWASLLLCYCTHQPLPQANIRFSALPTALFTSFSGADTWAFLPSFSSWGLVQIFNYLLSFLKYNNQFCRWHYYHFQPSGQREASSKNTVHKTLCGLSEILHAG